MIKRLVTASLMAGLVFAAASAFALPTVDAVQAEVKQGRFAKAEIMMQEVVEAKPNSAKAHYLYAEILAHNKAFDQAATELARARDLDPAASFTDPVKFKAFEQLLAREQQAARPKLARSNAQDPASNFAGPAPASEPSNGLPGWVWALGIGGVLALVWAVVNRRTQRSSANTSPMAMSPGMGNMNVSNGTNGANGMIGGAAAGYGPTGNYPAGLPGMPGRSGGVGMMGVGLAAAGGVAAGMLAEKLMHGGNHDSSGGNNAASYDHGGSTSGNTFDTATDNPAARELEQRDVDFGNGAGWDSGGDAGGEDAGGGSDDW